ncbi:CPBP family intramembrane glutamic endopeptidase [Neosynechococcus sphagnicola]|uniref:CPBP family intramembrane glutamic endopeptidase n=1 Tax=Neosynechococcus sphagnicola TaxID=1501145 RepID=UPI000689FE0E|nr:CPBP family intramembrane glutamic endopeptidase [Neosynechococcus sphagnicola]
MMLIPTCLHLLLFFLIWVGLWLPFAVPLAITLHWRPSQPLQLQQKLPLLASLYVLAPLLLRGWLQVMGGTWADYGLVWQSTLGVSLGIGLGVGSLGLLFLFVGQGVWGWLQWQLQPGKLAALCLPVLLLALWISFTEELVFRGFVLTQLQAALPPWAAAVIASVIFALLHLIWEGQGTLPQIPGLWLMGMVLCLARWVDHNQLGLAWGLHAGWVWGIALLDLTATITVTNQAPQWLTGWDGKPLSGCLCLLLLLLTGGGIWGFNPHLDRYILGGFLG